jgi:uncharacterized membrane protein YfcA
MWLATVAIVTVVAAVGPWWLGGGSSGPADGGAATGCLVLLMLAALVCEFVDSSLGMGYGTSLTPLLLLAGFEPLQLVPCVLFSELVTGLFAGVMHHRDGNVDLFADRRARNTTLHLSLLTAVGAVGAVVFAVSVPPALLKGTIAGIIILAGVVVLISSRRTMQYRRGRLLTVGLVAAFNKGLSGGGYGPLATAGQVASGLPAKNAVAITSLTEALTCFIGLAVYLLLGEPLDWRLAGALTLGACLSVPMATSTVKLFPESLLRGAIGTVACLLGILTLTQLF